MVKFPPPTAPAPAPRTPPAPLPAREAGNGAGIPADPAPLAAVGQVTPLVHSGGYANGVDEGLAGRIEGTLLFAFLIRSFVVSLVLWAPFAVVALLLAVAGHSAGPWDMFAVLAGFAGFVGALFVPFREAISSWWALVDNRADAADSAYAAIYSSVRDHNYPMACTPRRIRNEFQTRTARNYLVVSDGPYVAYASVFGYGTGLYMGWTMWRRRLPVIMFFSYLKQQVDVVSGRGTLFHLILRAEVVQAFREALHACVKEGLDVAIAGLDVPITATFGYDVPVEASIDRAAGTAEGSQGPLPALFPPPLPPPPSAPPPSVPPPGAGGWGTDR